MPLSLFSPLASRFHRRAGRRGQTLVEYALIIALIAVVAIGVLMATGTSVRGTFNTVNTQLNNAQQGGAVATPPPRN